MRHELSLIEWNKHKSLTLLSRVEIRGVWQWQSWAICGCYFGFDVHARRASQFEETGTAPNYYAGDRWQHDLELCRLELELDRIVTRVVLPVEFRLDSESHIELLAKWRWKNFDALVNILRRGQDFESTYVDLLEYCAGAGLESRATF